MIKLYDGGAFLINGKDIVPEKDASGAAAAAGRNLDKEEARKGTIAYGILKAHNTSDNMDKLKIKFDAMASHDITFVGIVQTAKASGMKEFPIPYVLTNCHNSLCAVGGTINEDDHMFGLSAAKKYGGIYVPPHIAVIHQYMRERHAGCGRMIIGSDSHTRYGALGTMAVGEGGGELVKQLLRDTYDISYPGVVGVYLDGKPAPGVGPQDIALAIIGAVFKNGYVKNKVMEFVGPGVASMECDYRNGVDVMTTETTCLSSIWRTDEKTKAFLTVHGRGDDYRQLDPEEVAYYDGMIYIDLSTVKPMIALPFHPSNTYEIEEFLASPADILREIEKEAAVIQENPDLEFSLTDKVDASGKVRVQQGIIAGCAGGTYSSICEAAHILKNANCGNDEFTLSVYPSSQPVFMELVKNGAITDLMAAGAAIKTAFCGPCFGAGDTPANNALSIRHTTRNFPNREGSKPGNGQLSAVALMDARSIAATAANGGVLTPATAFADDYVVPEYSFDESSYTSRVYSGFGKGQGESELVYGPNIKDWPELPALSDNILLKVCSRIMDPVTTTDELIPSGETSSFRSNPLGLAEFTLSRRDPEYVARAKAVKTDETEILEAAFGEISGITPGASKEDVEVGSVIYCVKPGDGSAREQAASCQRVLGGLANICREYATKRYRSNVMNWGMVPFQMAAEPDFRVGDLIYVPGIKEALAGDMKSIKAYVLGENAHEIELFISDMTAEEKEIVKAGCLINYNKRRME
ncbi:MAG: hydratase [Clostridiales bacterium]|nr:hydratase [Clostridiales bacterium]MDD7130293.1 hydratase [Bacillota bacterium]MDY5606645.1 hydratase [Lentihominibacter sp.]